MKRTKSIAFPSIIVSVLWGSMPAVAARPSGALSFLENSDAKYAALGEAGTAGVNDVSVMNYNPAGLATLETGQASFLYQKGFTEDAFGRFMIGAPTKAGTLALSGGYYDAGTVEVDDGTGIGTRQLDAQKDYLFGLGYAQSLGWAQVGANVKYLKSTLVEQYSASAVAVDLGLHRAVSSRLRIGAAVQNLGNGLKYVDQADPLPTNYRLGAAFALRSGANAPTLLVDAPYFINERQVRPALGLDVPVGPLSLRAGYRNTGASHDVTLGAGFAIGRWSFDYSLGLASELSAAHRVSFSLRFGELAAAPAFVSKPNPGAASAQRPVLRTVVQNETPSRYSLGSLSQSSTSRRRVYVVQRGDNLAMIAKHEYGDARQWKAIYAANKYLLADPTKLEAGQKIVLP